MTTTVSKTMYTETAHRLVDYPNGRCQHWHGHSYKWEVTVSAKKLDAIGMVVDFKALKAAMVKIIDPLDHALILNKEDPFVITNGEEATQEIMRSTAGKLPRLFLVPFNPTAENMVNWIAPLLEAELPENIIVTKIRLWETATSFAEYTDAD